MGMLEKVRFSQQSVDWPCPGKIRQGIRTPPQEHQAETEQQAAEQGRAKSSFPAAVRYRRFPDMFSLMPDNMEKIDSFSRKILFLLKKSNMQ
jgi:hypothetical protein